MFELNSLEQLSTDELILMLALMLIHEQKNADPRDGVETSDEELQIMVNSNLLYLMPRDEVVERLISSTNRVFKKHNIEHV